MANKINFISNNVKGLQSTNKRLTPIKYFKDKIVSDGFLFLQETYSTVNDEIKWKNDLKVKSFTRTVNLTHAVFSFVSQALIFFLLGISYLTMMAVY